MGPICCRLMEMHDLRTYTKRIHDESARHTPSQGAGSKCSRLLTSMASLVRRYTSLPTMKKRMELVPHIDCAPTRQRILQPTVRPTRCLLEDPIAARVHDGLVVVSLVVGSQHASLSCPLMHESVDKEENGARFLQVTHTVCTQTRQCRLQPIFLPTGYIPDGQHVSFDSTYHCQHGSCEG